MKSISMKILPDGFADEMREVFNDVVLNGVLGVILHDARQHGGPVCDHLSVGHTQHPGQDQTSTRKAHVAANVFN